MHHKTFPRVRAAIPAAKSAAAAPLIAPLPPPATSCSAKRQSASRQMPVELFNAEGQHHPPAASRALEAPDALSKLFDHGRCGWCTHVLGRARRIICSIFVLILQRESIGLWR